MITADFLTTILIFGIVFWEHANCAAPASREIRADFVDLVGNHWEPELNPKISPSLMTSSQIPRDKSQITVTFFPPEYCQTARICFDKNRTAFCREQEITWNLATSQITVFLAGKPVDNKKTTWFSDDLTLSNIENPKKTHKFEYWEAQPYFNKRTWDKSKKKSGQMKNDIKGAWITVLTNSRQCQPYIFVDGVVQNQYYFGESKIASKMPKIFTYNAKPISTFYTDSIPSKSHTRTTDHFPMLKKLKKPRKSLGQLKFEHCNIGAAEETASIISKPSFLRLSVAKTPGKPPKGSISSEKILIDLGDCHWMRVWITKTSNWEKDYAKTIDREIGQTIDFIFGAGIGFLPDRENAIIIPYSPENIAKISIDHHGDGLAQISFGENLGNFLNSWSFNMPILKESGYFVYLIRAPKCRANFDVDFGALGLFGAGGDGAKPYSRIEFKQCEIRMIQK